MHIRTRPAVMVVALVLAAVMVTAQVSCSPGRTTFSSGEVCDRYPDRNRELPDGSCAGVTLPEICAVSYCYQDADCRRVWHVMSEAPGPGAGSEASPFPTLGQAAAVAVPGECIALAAGRYVEPGVTLAGGVSLLGRGADLVQVVGSLGSKPALTVAAGRGGLLRGVTLTGAGVGLALQKISGLHVTQVRVARARSVGVDAREVGELVLDHSHIQAVEVDHHGVNGEPAGFGIGILLAEGSAAEVTLTVVERSGTQGILAHDSVLELERSAVERSGQYGVAVACDLWCQGRPSSISRSMILDSKGLGLLVLGGEVQARENLIAGTRYEHGFARGVSVGLGARVELLDNVIQRSQGQGLVIDGSTGRLADNRIEGNESFGVALKQISGEGVRLENNLVLSNEVSGIRSEGSTAVTIVGGRVAQTRSRPVLGPGGTAAQVGDGVQILDGSKVTLTGVTLQANQRIGVIIDASEAVVSDLIISGSQAPLVVQNADLSLQTISNVTDPDGAGIAAVVPASPYVVGGGD